MRLGIDIGGTKTAAVAIGADGELSDQVRMPTGFGAEAVVATALRTVERMTQLAGVEASAFSSIGIGIPGAVDGATGRVEHAVNLGLEGLDLGRRLTDRLGVDVRVENDVKAAALDGLVLVVGKDLHRHPFAVAAIEALRAVRDDVVTVDMGWPSEDRAHADIATFGASRLVGAALLELLAPRPVLAPAETT